MENTSVLLENTPLVKFIRNYIWDSSGVFSISSLVRISIISLISSLSIKLFFNSLVYGRNIFGSSSKVFHDLWKSSGIYGIFRKMFGNVRVIFGKVFENLRKSSESVRKSSENCQKRRHRDVYIIKRTLHEHKIHIFSPPCNILYFPSRKEAKIFILKKPKY